MTLKDLKKLSVLQTQSINNELQDEDTTEYIIDCLCMFYRGNYGTVCTEDITANNLDLKDGYGHILARYNADYELKEDIYIEANINKDIDLTDINYNNIIIMYVGER